MVSFDPNTTTTVNANTSTNSFLPGAKRSGTSANLSTPPQTPQKHSRIAPATSPSIGDKVAGLTQSVLLGSPSTPSKTLMQPSVSLDFEDQGLITPPSKPKSLNHLFNQLPSLITESSSSTNRSLAFDWDESDTKAAFSTPPSKSKLNPLSSSSTIESLTFDEDESAFSTPPSKPKLNSSSSSSTNRSLAFDLDEGDAKTAFSSSSSFDSPVSRTSSSSSSTSSSSSSTVVARPRTITRITPSIQTTNPSGVMNGSVQKYRQGQRFYTMSFNEHTYNLEAIGQGDHNQALKFLDDDKININGKILDLTAIIIRRAAVKDKLLPDQRLARCKGYKEDNEAYAKYQALEKEIGLKLLPEVYHQPNPIEMPAGITSKQSDRVQALFDRITSSSNGNFWIIERLSAPVSIDPWQNGQKFEELSTRDQALLQFIKRIIEASARKGHAIVDDLKPANVMRHPDGSYRICDISGSNRDDFIYTLGTQIHSFAGNNDLIANYLISDLHEELRKQIKDQLQIKREASSHQDFNW